MSDQHRLIVNPPDASVPNVAPPDPPDFVPDGALAPWSHDRIRAGLVADDAMTRTIALAKALQPDSPLDLWVPELLRCVQLSAGDDTALQLAATVITQLKTQPAREAALPTLAQLAGVEQPTAVRAMVANGFWLFGAIPIEAWPAVAQMVFSTEAGLRKVAFSAALPHATVGAPAIANAAAQAGASGWTTEGLDLLAASAGTSETKKRQIEDYVLRTLKGETNLTVMTAGYAALARLNPKGPGVSALLQVVSAATQWSDAERALAALSQLGDAARSAVPGLVALLVATDDPEREDALCKTLLELKITDREVPIARVVQRVESGPDQSVVAHCIFLSLHRKAFARLAPIVAARFAQLATSEPLKIVLDAVHEMLAGTVLIAATPANKT
jgi:hypothetical protein